MSNGGLLEKAAEQQASGALVAEVTAADGPADQVGAVEALKTVTLLGLIPIVIARWLEAYVPWNSLELSLGPLDIALFMPLVYLVTLGIVLWRLGLVSEAGIALSGVGAGVTSVVAVFYMLMLLFPLILGAVLEGELSVGEVEYSEDGEEITVKLRQNTLSSKDVEATVAIMQSGSEVWSSTVNVAIDKSDGQGEFGSFTISVSDFFNKNALPGSPYTLKVTVDGQETTRDLSSIQIKWSGTGAQWNGDDALTREVTGVSGSTSGVVKSDPDRCGGGSDNCLVGVVLSAWAGLDTGADKPVRMPFADYAVDAVLKEGNDVAVTYPTVTVNNTQANWDSEDGKFGSGSGFWGDYGSDFPLEGSVTDASYGTYVPRDEFDSAGDYGCYSFIITVTQGGNDPVSHTSYYEYSSSNSNDIWEPVSIC